MVKKEVNDTLNLFRSSYNITIASVLTIFLFFDNDLKKSFQELNYVYFISYFILLIASYYFFFTCKNNQGYAETIPKTKHQVIELRISINKSNRSGLSGSLRENNVQEHRESLLSSLTGLSSFQESFPSSRNNSDDEEKVNERSPRGKSERKGEEARKTKKNRMPEQRFCEICDVIQPFRTKHCHQCERCINKYDHHCDWIGGCVGELNHRKFYLFLILQSAVQIWSLRIANSGLNGIGEYHDQEGSSFKIYEYIEWILFVIIFGVTALATVFPVLLLALHTWLIITNQTTWEFRKRKTLNYLAIYPKNFHPFSKGVIENLKMTFLHGNKMKEWELPLPPNASG